MMTKNYNCDGDRCVNAHGEVRVYPTGNGANLILCLACWAHENRYRHIRARWYGQNGDAEFPQNDWAKAETYPRE